MALKERGGICWRGEEVVADDVGREKHESSYI